MSRSEQSPVVVGIMYPTDWETRPREQLDADLSALTAIDPRIELVHARYLDTSELRGRRGADPTADLRSEAPQLTAELQDALTRVEVVLAMDLPFDVAQLAPNLRWVQGMGAGVSQLASAGLADAGIRLDERRGRQRGVDQRVRPRPAAADVEAAAGDRRAREQPGVGADVWA